MTDGNFYKTVGNTGKIKRIDLHQTPKLLHSKGNHYKMKRQPTEQEKTFANHISDKGLIKNSYENSLLKNSYNSIAKEINNPIKKMGRRSE